MNSPLLQPLGFCQSLPKDPALTHGRLLRVGADNQKKKTLMEALFFEALGSIRQRLIAFEETVFCREDLDKTCETVDLKSIYCPVIPKK
jgi:hypothetical protein